MKQIQVHHALMLGVTLLLSVAIAACAPTSNPTPTSVPFATFSTPTTATQPTTAPSPSALPSAATATSAPTRVPATGTPITLATVAAGNPSGVTANVYAAAIRLSPSQPLAGTDYVTFFVSFNNTSGKPQTLKWIVKIWSPDNSSKSFGETSAQSNDIPTGTSEIASAANWRTNPITCQPFYARVYWVNTDITADPVEFKKPDGSPGPLTNFQVCPTTPKP